MFAHAPRLSRARLANAVGRLPRGTIATMKLRKPRVGDDYTTGSIRDGIVMIVVILTVITALWLAYGWALGVPGAADG